MAPVATTSGIGIANLPNQVSINILLRQIYLKRVTEAQNRRQERWTLYCYGCW